jgi:hypothetical protein
MKEVNTEIKTTYLTVFYACETWFMLENQTSPVVTVCGGESAQKLNFRADGIKLQMSCKE